MPAGPPDRPIGCFRAVRAASRRGLACPGPPALRRLDPGRFPRLLVIVRRPRGVRQPGRLVLLGQPEQRVQRASRVVHPLPRVTQPGETFRHGVDGERLRPAIGDFVPVQRGRDPGVRGRAHRVRRCHRPVLRVLVVVHEDAVPFLFPPLRGGQVRCPALDLAGQGHGGLPDLGELPAPLDPGVDVEAARAGRLGPAGQPEVGQYFPGDQRDLEDLGPFHPRHRVQIDAELVRVLEVVGPDRVRVEVDAAQVDGPDQGGSVPGHDLHGAAPGREAQLHRVDPGRPGLRRPLLEERLALRAVHEALEHHGTSRGTGHGPVRHAEVVPDQVKLGVPGTREEDLARIGDGHLVACHLQDFLAIGHGATITGAHGPGAARRRRRARLSSGCPRSPR